MKQFLLALQFLTIIPVRIKGDVSENHMLGSAVFFPLVGLMQGCLLLAAAYGLSHLTGPLLSSALLVFLMALVNGGFHLDGLADTMDGLASRGGREQRLDVMHDGATGPVGTAAIAFALMIKFAALGEIIAMGPGPLGLALIFMPAVSRWVMLLGMNRSVPARADGLGRIFIGRVGIGAVAANGLLLMVLMVLPVMQAGWACEPLWHFFPPVALLACLGFALLFDRSLKRAFGGQTGDTLGATGEITEVIYIIIVSVWSNLFIS